jgi:hypothetical protein
MPDLPSCTGSGTKNDTNGLYSDPFTEACLAPWWTLQDVQGDASVSVGSTGAVISVPSSTNGYDLYQKGDQTAVLTQALTGNTAIRVFLFIVGADLLSR